jgi:hypothetical protein
MQMEESFKGMAALEQTKAVVICDRALLDIKAYIPAEQVRCTATTAHAFSSMFACIYFCSASYIQL